jgi:hypothetical protein
MGHLSPHQKVKIGMFYDLKLLNIANKFKKDVKIAKVKGIEISEVSVKSIMAKWFATSTNIVKLFHLTIE